jgi:hypothetical protein
MLVDIQVKIAPEVYEEYVTNDIKGNKQILVDLDGRLRKGSC